MKYQINKQLLIVSMLLSLDFLLARNYKVRLVERIKEQKTVVFFTMFLDDIICKSSGMYEILSYLVLLTVVW